MSDFQEAASEALEELQERLPGRGILIVAVNEDGVEITGANLTPAQLTFVGNLIIKDALDGSMQRGPGRDIH